MSGKFDEMKGRAQKAAGDLTDNNELKAEGERDEKAGKAKQAVDKVGEKVEGAIDSVKDALKRDK